MLIIQLSLILSVVTIVQCWESGHDVKLSDWDSTLYGQAICTKIPSEMSLCKNINYDQMKMPNLLGHETIKEIVQQSSVWNPLLGINCHKDTQIFLCSLFAPVCIKQAIQATIYPCRSLCESVKSSCEAPMLSYNYPWPSMFNCSQFPEDNGFCIQPSDLQKTVPTTTLPVKTTPEYVPVTRKYVPADSQYGVNHQSKRIGRQETCHACKSQEDNLEQVVKSYCSSRIALRGRVSEYSESKFQLDQKYTAPRRPNIFSNHIIIPRRDRRFFKGGRILFGTSGPFLTEENLQNYFRNQKQTQFSPIKDLDFFVLSNNHLNTLRTRRRKIQRSLNKQKRTAHCSCPQFENNTIYKRYFLTANVVRMRKTMVKKPAQVSMKRQYFTRFTRDASRRRARFLQNHFRMVQVTGIYQWNKVRPFIDYLDNYEIDKSGMCNDIKETVQSIIKADSMFF